MLEKKRKSEEASAKARSDLMEAARVVFKKDQRGEKLSAAI